MRTGDLGFIYEDNLYITGRLKDVVIIRGANYYPNDIERTVEQSHPALNASGAAAFSVEVAGEESLVVMQEIKRTELRRLDKEAVVEAIRGAVTEHHELSLYAIVLIKPATLSKTSSGKVQRSICRQNFLDDSISKEISRWQHNSTATRKKPLLPILKQLKHGQGIARFLILQQHLIREVAIVMEITDAGQIEVQKDLILQGMDSLMQIELTRVLSDSLNISLSATVTFEYPNVIALTQYLLAEVLLLDDRIMPNNDADTTLLTTVSTERQPSAINSQQLQAVTRERNSIVSLVQRRYWFHQATDLNSHFHNAPWALQIKGKLDTQCLQKSWDELVKRHEILRTSFPLLKDEPIQRLHSIDEVNITIQPQNFRSFSLQERQQHINELQNISFNLQQLPLVNINLIECGDDDFILLICQHHIITDMQSLIILTQELWSVYQAFLEKQASPLSELSVQYADYAIWQQQSLQPSGLQKRFEYWQEWMTPSEPNRLELPTDRPRQHDAFSTRSFPYTLATDLSVQIKQAGRDHQVSSLVMGMSALAILLHQYSQCSDIIIGTTFSYRENRKLQVLVGPLTSVLQIRLNLHGNPSFKDFIQQTQQTVQHAIVNQDVPFQHIANHFKMPSKQDPSIPFFRVLLTFFPDLFEQWSGAELNVTSMKMEHQLINRPDLVLWMSENKQSSESFFQGLWRYREDLFNQSTVEKMATDFQVIMLQMVSHPEQGIDD
jgi:hypothetical protein